MNSVKPKIKTDYLTARISTKAMEKLKRISEQRGVSVTAVITESLVDLFRKEGLPTL